MINLTNTCVNKVVFYTIAKAVGRDTETVKKWIALK